MTGELTGRALGGFQIGDLVGEGGMGAVYRATRPGWPQAMAIKVLSNAYAQDREFRTRFMREGQVLSQLSHENIIPVYTVGEDAGHLYFVMRYIKGLSLHELMLKRRFSPVAAWQIIRPLTSALDYAHERDIIHRDIKPANILIEVEKDGEKLRNTVFLADFGLSKVLSWSALTESGISVGTPQYMSPEQVMDYPLTPASDVYALAVVVYEMLLGRLPFYARRPEQVAFAHIDKNPPLPTSLIATFPRPFEDVLMTALRKDPATRYQTAGDFAHAYSEAARAVGPEASRVEYYVGPPPEAR
jgi:serine/threonine-protein kinase